jgi:hypothetical protein
MQLAPSARKGPPYLNLLCVQEQAGWRVMVHPRWVPEFLAALFDVHGEVAPVWLDFEDLDRHMTDAGVKFEKRPTKFGGVELTAEGAAAEALASWLSTAIMSGTRPSAHGAAAADPEQGPLAG